MAQNQYKNINVLLPGGEIKCGLCHHACMLRDGKRGICGVRRRQGEEIVSLVYGRLVAENVDPVEKKPFFHVQPGSMSYSIATVGCNFSCLHCQNSSISQVKIISGGTAPGRIRTAEEVVAAALENACRSISYTYVEPTIFFEFAMDCCRLAKEAGLKNLFVSNGYMTREVLDLLEPHLDAINIDLKGFSETFYKKVCGARLAPVLETIKECMRRGIWVEVTTLLIPGMNDSDDELGDIARFLVTVDPDIPWHVTGYYPSYKMTELPPTPAEILGRARAIGFSEGLRYVYTGNRPGYTGENTCCPTCGSSLLTRHGFQLQSEHLQHGCCPDCATSIAGIW